MNPKLILVDVDETVLSFADPFQDWLEARGHVRDYRLRDAYSVEEFLGVDTEEAFRTMNEFARTESMISQPAEPDALEVLPKLRERGYRFVAITACGTDRAFAKRRTEILEDVFGFPFEAVHCVPFHGSKREYLEFYRPSYWVEDNRGHAIDGACCGHTAFLLDRAYNRSDDGPRHPKIVKRVKDWHEIEREITGFESVIG